ncbi:hypothetical protein VIGAN_04000400, partial [Vigna angularis var. angularis]
PSPITRRYFSSRPRVLDKKKKTKEKEEKRIQKKREEGTFEWKRALDPIFSLDFFGQVFHPTLPTSHPTPSKIPISILINIF